MTTIIFDLWETLGTKNVGISKSLQEKFGIPRTDDFLKQYEMAVQVQEWSTEAEMAKSFLATFGVEASEDNIDFVIALFRKGVSDATLFDGVPELLTALKERGCKLGLLSNTTVFESVVVKTLGLEKFFDVTVFSWQKGNLKPSPEAFDDIIAQLGVSKDQVLFVDDAEKNILAAREYGIHAVQFESVPLLLEELARLGVL